MTLARAAYDIAEFSRYCGPRALAAVTSRNAVRAALALRDIAIDSREPPGYSVSPRTLAEALREWGLVVEAWDVQPGGWRRGLVDAERHMGAADIRSIATGLREIHEQRAHEQSTQHPAVRAALEPDHALRAARYQSRHVRSLTVDVWLRRFPRMTWVLTVAGHVLAARGGTIVAGGDTYGDHALLSAWRVAVPYA